MEKFSFSGLQFRIFFADHFQKLKRLFSSVSLQQSYFWKCINRSLLALISQELLTSEYNVQRIHKKPNHISVITSLLLLVTWLFFFKYLKYWEWELGETKILYETSLNVKYSVIYRVERWGISISLIRFPFIFFEGESQAFFKWWYPVQVFRKNVRVIRYGKW